MNTSEVPSKGHDHPLPNSYSKFIIIFVSHQRSIPSELETQGKNGPKYSAAHHGKSRPW